MRPNRKRATRPKKEEGFPRKKVAVKARPRKKPVTAVAKPTKSKPNVAKNLQSAIRRAETALTQLTDMAMAPALKEKKAKERAKAATYKARRARATKPKPATAKARNNPASYQTHGYERP